MAEKRYAYLLIVLTTITSTAVAAAEAMFPKLIIRQQVTLTRCSTAPLKAFRFFEVGQAGLYLDQCGNNIEIFSPQTKFLRFLYSREIPKRAFQEAADKYLQSNLGIRYASMETVFNRFNNAYQDVQFGDYYDLIYESGAGLILQLNGKTLAAIVEPEIALAYFNIWFGATPFSDGLKQALLTLE